MAHMADNLATGTLITQRLTWLAILQPEVGSTLMTQIKFTASYCLLPPAKGQQVAPYNMLTEAVSKEAPL